jgi:hypothetical protein
MELVISVIVILVAYCLFHKLGGLAQTSKDAQKLTGQVDGPSDKAGLSPGIELVLRKEPEYPNEEPGETISVIVTEGDSFQEEWEVIPDSEEGENSNPSYTFHSKTIH